MRGRPRVSIVTPLVTPSDHLGGSLESVRAQDYPDLEHIVVDARPLEGAWPAPWPYARVKVVRAPKACYGEAVNTGCQLASGEILGILDPADTLLPGALSRTAAEIDPVRGRHVVMGRCRFVDGQGRDTGIEHPCRFEGHRRVLEVWKGYAIPPPAVFWTAEVWKACGPMDDDWPEPWINYELFCRFSRRYPFHVIGQTLATYRLQGRWRTEWWTAPGRLEDAIRLSRRYWGSPLTPMRWRLALSLALFRLNRAGRSRDHLRCMEDRWRRGDGLRAVPHALASVLLAPEVAFYVAMYPRVQEWGARVRKEMLDRLGQMRGRLPQTVAYLDHVEVWSDGWVGPRLRLDRQIAFPAQSLTIKGWTELRYMEGPLILTIRLDNQLIGRRRIDQPGDFALGMPLPDRLAPGRHTVEVEATAWYVPHRFARNGDFRPLAWRLGALEFDPAP